MMSNYLSSQDVFDKVVAHLRKQKRRSLDHGVCAYRGDHGTKCAVGCLITDEQYLPEMEGRSIYRLLEAHGDRVSHLEHHVALLSEFQGIHDTQSPDEWESAFQETAMQFALTYTAPV